MSTEYLLPRLNPVSERIFHLHPNVFQPGLQVVGVFLRLLIKHIELHSHVFVFDLPKGLSMTKPESGSPAMSHAGQKPKPFDLVLKLKTKITPRMTGL